MKELQKADRKAQEQVAETGGRRLVRRTFIIALVMISTGFIVAGAVELSFRYQESEKSVFALQTEMAEGAAFELRQFMREIANTMRHTAQTPKMLDQELVEALELELIKFFKAVPAITAISALDLSGRERFKLSRLAVVQAEDLTFRGEDEAFLRAKGGEPYFGPVHFVRESEPYAQIATPIERFAGDIAGVLIAEVNLKFIWDVVSDIRVGENGYAYIVSGDGDLIAHPDISLVLARPSFRELAQVKDALAGESGPFPAYTNFAGEKVFAAYAAIPDLSWVVLVERPTAEAYASLYASLLRSSVLLLVGLGMAILASLMIGYRVVRPLQTLRQGVARISGGDLNYRIDVRTGDELEMLAREFNEMTTKLRQSYARIERTSHLKRFLSPQLAELIETSRDADLLNDHRREITVVFCDLRNFTEFSSLVEPEEAMQVLREYYQVICLLLQQFEATIEHFAGDGLMAFFNDPVPCPEPEVRAVRMAVAMQRDVGTLIDGWRKRGIRLGFGIGISSGYATLGRIGSEGQFHYAAIGSVANLASRLCDKAESGQILITEAVQAKLGELAEVKPIGELSLKGFPKPVPVLEVVIVQKGRKRREMGHSEFVSH